MEYNDACDVLVTLRCSAVIVVVALPVARATVMYRRQYSVVLGVAGGWLYAGLDVRRRSSQPEGIVAYEPGHQHLAVRLKRQVRIKERKREKQNRTRNKSIILV